MIKLPIWLQTLDAIIGRKLCELSSAGRTMQGWLFSFSQNMDVYEK